MKKQTIAIIGCGNMGMIYARAFAGSRARLFLVEKNNERCVALRKLGLGEVMLPTDARIGEAEVLVLAVKPQDFHALSDDLRKVISRDNFIISIMAGIRISSLQETLGSNRVVRAMPNSPAEFGFGMTGWYAGPDMDAADRVTADHLLLSTGRTLRLKK